MRDKFGADAPAAAAAVLDYHWLAERLADQIARYASDDVGIAAGGERHDQMDRPLRKGGKRALRQQWQNGGRAERGNECAAYNGHNGFSSSGLLAFQIRPAGSRAIFFIIFTPISLAFNPR
jgi:hypothetical protein